MSDAAAPRFRAATDEAPATRLALIASVKTLATPDARDAIRLTLTIAAISVPLNAIFGVGQDHAAAHPRRP
jgi:ABC-type sulfate transport system permease subunit